MIKIFNRLYEESGLTPSDISYLRNIPQKLPEIEWLWSEMDRIWDELGANNKVPLHLQQDKISDFYSHPVWIVNGIFSEQDQTSLTHRVAIAEFIKENKLKKIADYGGGSGVLAKEILKINPGIHLDIIEPYPFPFFVNQHHFLGLQYINKLNDFDYDLIIAQDVLEHLDDPLKTAYNISQHVKINGYVVFANCFYPVIKCHLPKNFYLRHTFFLSMKMMGNLFLNTLTNAKHVEIYRRKDLKKLSKSKIFFLKIFGRIIIFTKKIIVNKHINLICKKIWLKVKKYNRASKEGT